jgi:hypothetical protein
MKDELERMWKKVVMAFNSLEGLRKTMRNLRTTCDPAEIQIKHPLNKSQELRQLIQLLLSISVTRSGVLYNSLSS